MQSHDVSVKDDPKPTLMAHGDDRGAGLHDADFRYRIAPERQVVRSLGQSRPERRLAAILAADVVGYSRLMGANEAGTAQVLLEHRAAIAPVVAGHDGRIVKTTGDGVLVEFSSVVAAVECAAAIQKLMAQRNAHLPQDEQMLFRIGINVGDVLVDGEDILGDGVNIAARLEGIAEPGGMCISDDAYRHVQGKVSAQFVDSGEQQLKNISRPVRVYHVLPQGSAGARTALALPDKPSIAVLPFENVSDFSEDVYFADGIAEDIITELSRYPDLFVVARNSSFTYRGKVGGLPTWRAILEYATSSKEACAAPARESGLMLS